jgi:hypothetical protein
MLRFVLIAIVILSALTIEPPIAYGEEPASATRSVLFQRNDSGDRDSLWNGILIGAAVGAVVGMFIAPQAYCGAHDTECATIVRVALGLPAIGAGIGVGALVDGLHKSRAFSPVPFANAPSVRFRVTF